MAVQSLDSSSFLFCICMRAQCVCACVYMCVCNDHQLVVVKGFFALRALASLQIWQVDKSSLWMHAFFAKVTVVYYRSDIVCIMTNAHDVICQEKKSLPTAAL